MGRKRASRPDSAYGFGISDPACFMFGDSHGGQAGEDEAVGDPSGDGFPAEENLTVQGKLRDNEQGADQQPDQRGAEALQKGSTGFFRIPYQISTPSQNRKQKSCSERTKSHLIDWARRLSQKICGRQR